MDGDALIGAIDGVLKGTLGSVRTVPAAAFGDDVSADTPEYRQWLRGMVKPQFDIVTTPPLRTGDVGPSTASLAILEVLVDVELRFAADALAEMRSSERKAVRARVMENAATVTRALTWPGNLTVDGSANATSLVSGKLRERARPTVTREDWKAGIYAVELHFDGLVQETQAVA